MASCRKPERGHADGRGLVVHWLQLLTSRKAWPPSRSTGSVIPRAALPSRRGPALSRAPVTLATVQTSVRQTMGLDLHLQGQRVGHQGVTPGPPAWPAAEAHCPLWRSDLSGLGVDRAVSGGWSGLCWACSSQSQTTPCCKLWATCSEPRFFGLQNGADNHPPALGRLDPGQCLAHGKH